MAAAAVDAVLRHLVGRRLLRRLRRYNGQVVDQRPQVDHPPFVRVVHPTYPAFGVRNRRLIQSAASTPRTTITSAFKSLRFTGCPYRMRSTFFANQMATTTATTVTTTCGILTPTSLHDGRRPVQPET